MVERLHRQLKGALRARLTTEGWLDDLALVLLGIRSAWREAADNTPAELVYGTSLRLPGQFVPGTSEDTEASDSFVENFLCKMRQIRHVPSDHHGGRPVSVPSSLASARAVYIRHDAIRKPLQRPYDGPFPVLKAGPKHFIVQRNGSPYSVSVDRLKPAVLPPLDQAPPPPLGPTTTSSGRVSRLPQRLNL